MLTPGQTLQERYRIVQQLGQGGMAVVYLAADSRLGDRQVAIKEMDASTLPAADQQWAIAAFKQEAEVLARLGHPGIARVLDFFSEGNFWYLVMEYVQGETLDQALKRSPYGFAEDQALEWARQLASVLEYLHQQIHPSSFVI